MTTRSERTPFRHGLSFLATLAFVVGFFGARLFHTVLPGVMVITRGIHFHHFWYGLAMIGVAGWMGIAYPNQRLARIYAIVFGLGAGFVGDEVGLLLTFGDYYSQLTTLFFVAAISFVILVTLLTRYREHLEEDVFRLSAKERLTLVGVFAIGFSTLFLAFGMFYVAIALIIIGILFLWRFGRRQRGGTEEIVRVETPAQGKQRNNSGQGRPLLRGVRP